VFNRRLSASGSLRLTVFRAAHPYDVLAIWFRGLLSPIQTVETRKAHSRAPEQSAARLAPRALSAGVVVSLGEGFVGAWYKKRRRVGLRNRLYRFVQNV
jgi:hypothetical protein